MEKYILVTGGELYNKGAQAMTFITADEIAKRWPDCKMVLLSSRDAKRPEIEKNKYKFEIQKGINWKIKLGLHIPVIREILCLKRKNNCYRDMMLHTEALIDISGFAIGDQWDSKNIILLLISRILDLNMYNIPVYFMPQSFGPFEFKGKYKTLVNMALKICLPKVSLIMAREEEGYQLLKARFDLHNVMKSYDLVLKNKGINIDNVIQKADVKLPLDIEDDGKNVAIIPNIKNQKYIAAGDILEMYREIVKFLRNKRNKVYLIYHSTEDYEICKQIKSNGFQSDSGVVLIEKELSCLEFDLLVKNMNYIVASRYHSIVHAYRRGVPALGIGWAVKYFELMNTFSQGKYQIDVRKGIDVMAIVKLLGKLDENWNNESATIKKELLKVQEDNIYDYIKLKSEME